MHLSPLLLALLQQPAAPSLPPSPVVKVEITPAGGEIQIGQTLQLSARALDGARHDPVSFTSNTPRVASVTNDGVLRALAPGRATVSATAGPVTRALAIQVVANTVARVTIEPAATSVRTGDVVRLTVTAK